MKKKDYKILKNLGSLFGEPESIKGIKDRAKVKSEKFIQASFENLQKAKSKLKNKFDHNLTNEDLDQLIHLVEEETSSSLNPKYYLKLKEKLEKLKG